MSEKNKAEALRRIRDGGAAAWADGKSRAGGAVSRLFDRMVSEGLCTKPPHTITERGTKWLASYAALHPPKCLHCGKPRSQHRAGARNCPVGTRHRTLGYTQFGNTTFYSTERP